MNGSVPTPGVLRLAALPMLIATLAAGCADRRDEGTNGRRGTAPDRTTPAEPDWRVGVRIGGTLDDSTLLMPLRPVVNGRGVYVADLGARRVVHFDHEGRLVWTAGRRGKGPGEFEQPRDLRLDARGRVWVLDTEILRVTVLDPSGAVERMSALGLWDTPSEIMPLADGTAIVAVGSPLHPFARVDSGGHAISRHAFPWPPFATMHGLSSQFITAHDPATSEWVTAFRVGDGFFHFRDADWKGYAGTFAEAVEFPTPTVRTEGNMTMTMFDSEPTTAAASVTLSPERIYVLFGGRGAAQFRVVDSFSRIDGGYLGSFLLPERAVHIAWHDGGFYTLRNQPYPELTYIRAGTAFP
jgi:hypothetical protein